MQKQHDRIKVSGFQKKQASTANGAATRYANTNIKDRQITQHAGEKYIDLGKIRNIHLQKTANKTHISSSDVEKIKNTIAQLSEEYDIKLDTIEVGDYADNKYRNM